MSSQVLALLVPTLMLSACFRQVKDDPTPPDPKPIPVRGTVADVKTLDGEIDGYRVSRACKSANCIGLQSMRGSKQFVSDSRETFERLRSSVNRSCKGISSLFSSGVSRGCAAEVPALVLWMFDWREADAALSCAGRQLVESDSRDPVAICVTDRWFTVED
jgi:hypothetical protein